jgi:hypothetical protein
LMAADCRLQRTVDKQLIQTVGSRLTVVGGVVHFCALDSEFTAVTRTTNEGVQVEDGHQQKWPGVASQPGRSILPPQ